MKIGIVLGSTRPGRLGTEVAEWVAKQATARDTATYEIVDVAEYDLDLLDDPVIPGAANREYASDKTRSWSATVDGRDTAVVRVNGALTGIVLPAGARGVELDYRPTSLPIGASITALALLGWLVWVARTPLRGRR